MLVMPPISEKLLHKSRDRFGDILVTEQNLIRTLYFGNEKKQTSMFVPEPSVMVLRYAQAMVSALMFEAKPKKILIIGLGGGSLIHFLLKSYPDCEIDIVELRRSVINIAKEYFFVPVNSPNITIAHGDAKPHVQQLAEHNAEIYDLILVDAFDEWGPAEINNDAQFVLNCQQLLKKKGVLSFNLWNREMDKYPAVYRKFLSLFDGNLLELSMGKRDSNVLLFGFNSDYHIKHIRAAEMRAIKLKMNCGIDFPRYMTLIQHQNFTLVKKIKKHFSLSF